MREEDAFVAVGAVTEWRSAHFRMSIVFFCLSALDLLGALEEKVPQEERQEIADWIYAQQLREKSCILLVVMQV